MKLERYKWLILGSAVVLLLAAGIPYSVRHFEEKAKAETTKQNLRDIWRALVLYWVDDELGAYPAETESIVGSQYLMNLPINAFTDREMRHIEPGRIAEPGDFTYLPIIEEVLPGHRLAIGFELVAYGQRREERLAPSYTRFEEAGVDWPSAIIWMDSGLGSKFAQGGSPRERLERKLRFDGLSEHSVFTPLSIPGGNLSTLTPISNSEYLFLLENGREKWSIVRTGEFPPPTDLHNLVTGAYDPRAPQWESLYASYGAGDNWEEYMQLVLESDARQLRARIELPVIAIARFEDTLTYAQARRGGFVVLQETPLGTALDSKFTWAHKAFRSNIPTLDIQTDGSQPDPEDPIGYGASKLMIKGEQVFLYNYPRDDLMNLSTKVTFQPEPFLRNQLGPAYEDMALNGACITSDGDSWYLGLTSGFGSAGSWIVATDLETSARIIGRVPTEFPGVRLEYFDRNLIVIDRDGKAFAIEVI